MTRLDEILKRCEAATPEPWNFQSYRSKHGLYDVLFPENDIKFMECARTDLPLVVKALQKAVGALKYADKNVDDADKLKRCRKTLAEITAMLGDGK